MEDTEGKDNNIKENSNQNLNSENNSNELPEPEISEEEMKNIINYINTLDFEKYQRDMEVREALLLLRNKMKQEEEEKQKNINDLKMKENQNNEQILNKDNSKDIRNYFEEEKIEEDNKYFTKYNESNNTNIFKDELSEKEKEILEKNWNSSTKPEFGEKIVNEKGDKEIIINNNKEKKIKKVKINIIYMF